MSQFQPIFGPEAFIKEKQQPSKFLRQFAVSNPKSQHILVVEVDSVAMSDKNLAIIKLNDKIIVNPFDFLFDKKKRFIKIIDVLDKNQIEIQMVGKPKSEIKLSILAAAEDGDILSPGILSLANLNSLAFNPVGAQIVLNLTEAVFATVNPSATIILNDAVLNESQYSMTSNTITINQGLVVGSNVIRVIAFDENGGMLDYESVLWAGNMSFFIEVVDKNGPVENADVNIALTDDKNIKIQGKTDISGRLLVSNIPNRTLFFLAKSLGRVTSSVQIVENNMILHLQLDEILSPSVIDNNNFSLGLEGWDTSESNQVELIPHTEENEINIASILSVKSLNLAPASNVDLSKMTIEEQKNYRKAQSNLKSASKSSLSNSSSISIMSAAVGDTDLSVSTGGKMGASKVKRAFKTKPGSNNVKVRYKFITSEIPGGYFGSIWNDGYSIILSSSTEGQIATDISSMNSMGIGAFSPSGASSWMELKVPVDPSGDIVQLMASVSNVGDGAYDSQIIIDYIEETAFTIKSAELYDIDNSLLNRLSVSASNPYLGGITGINGSIEITGDETDGVKSLKLQIIQGGSVKATANLAPSQSTIISRFDTSGVKKVSLQRLFNLTNIEAAGVDVSINGTLVLKIIAESTKGTKSELTIDRPIQLLTRSDLPASVRYNDNRDLDAGGDDWGTPSCVHTLNSLISTFSNIGFKVNDYSNMNGGVFAKHKGHQKGIDVDFVFNNSSNVDGQSAARLLQIARANSNIKVIGVSYEKVNGNSFYDAIKNELINGEAASSVIRKWEGHKDHFHIICDR